MRSLLAAAIVSALLAGCASTDQQAAQQGDDRYYVTGSNIKLHSSRGHISQTKSLSGETLQERNEQMPVLIPRPEGYRGAGGP